MFIFMIMTSISVLALRIYFVKKIIGGILNIISALL
jgi:hypothetical protein